MVHQHIGVATLKKSHEMLIVGRGKLCAQAKAGDEGEVCIERQKMCSRGSSSTSKARPLLLSNLQYDAAPAVLMR